jgi:hypothetical protein
MSALGKRGREEVFLLAQKLVLESEISAGTWETWAEA